MNDAAGERLSPPERHPMNTPEAASVVALSAGLAALGTTALLALLQRTRGVSPGRRVRLMSRLAALAVWSVLPPRWAVASLAAGLLAFAGSLLAGLVVTILIVRAIPPEMSHPTEAYEGFGDALLAMFRFVIGATLSVSVAIVVGLLTGGQVAWWYESRSVVVKSEP